MYKSCRRSMVSALLSVKTKSSAWVRSIRCFVFVVGSGLGGHHGGGPAAPAAGGGAAVHRLVGGGGRRRGRAVIVAAAVGGRGLLLGLLGHDEHLQAVFQVGEADVGVVVQGQDLGVGVHLLEPLGH